MKYFNLSLDCSNELQCDLWIVFINNKLPALFPWGELYWEIIGWYPDMNFRCTTWKHRICIIYGGLCIQCSVSFPHSIVDLLIHLFHYPPCSFLLTTILFPVVINLLSVYFSPYLLLIIVTCYESEITGLLFSTYSYISLKWNSGTRVKMTRFTLYISEFYS